MKIKERRDIGVCRQHHVAAMAPIAAVMIGMANIRRLREGLASAAAMSGCYDNVGLIDKPHRAGGAPAGNNVRKDAPLGGTRLRCGLRLNADDAVFWKPHNAVSLGKQSPVGS